MKKFASILLTLILSVLLCFTVVACNGSNPPPAQPNTYSVVFDTQGKCVVESQTVLENETAERPFPDPSCSTHDFGGWFVDTAYTVEFDFSAPITKNTFVYAKWTEIETTYTITFNNNGHGKAPAK